ncbi:MAG: hypothetical protein GMKNLPBB_02205 [Myxococcota bacterium]|nr:hypothetical protein [Myxococcota bacterium]
MKRRFPGWIAALILALTAGAAFAQQPPNVCKGGNIQDKLQVLRRMSLDIRGRVPDLAEYELVIQKGDLPGGLIDAWLESEDHFSVLKNYHRDLFSLNNITQRLANSAFLLRKGDYNKKDTEPPVYWIISGGRSSMWRGVYEPCWNKPSRTGAWGAIEKWADDPARPDVKKEGYVEVSPYWAPNTKIRVCAFDAQETVTTPNPRGGADIDCSTLQGSNVAACGCGPNLRFCQSVEDLTMVRIAKAMDDQLLRFADRVARENRPYTDLITAKDMEINGPLSHYLKYQTQTGPNILFALPNQNHPVPDIPFTQSDKWVEVQRGGRHAGLLTMPGYLVKYQTNRSRANRFYNAFLCQYFEAPPGGLPTASDACHSEPDLTKRCGCNYCHQTVEPAAAYWGRWAEAGLAPLEPVDEKNQPLFAKFRQECAGKNAGKNPVCKRFYLTEAHHESEKPYLGHLLPYVFAGAQREKNIEAGPMGIAQEAINNGEFARCTVRKMWKKYMGRDLMLDEEPVLADLAAKFQAGNHRLNGLIRNILSRPEYIEGERFQKGGRP